MIMTTEVRGPDDRRDDHPPRRAVRIADDRLLGGVAAGLGRHLGLDVVVVRCVFLVLAAMGGFGIVLYAGLWMTLPTDHRLQRSAPGLEAATRHGMRSTRPSRIAEAGPLVALAAVGVGVVALLQMVTGWGVFIWPLVLAGLGVAVLWRQADEAQRSRWVDSSGRIDLVRAVVGEGGAASYTRIVVGAALLVSALAVFAVQAGGIGVAREVVLAGVLGVAGLALIIGPWLFRLVGDLSEERTARVRSQERADLAAHLHDSVLQTLALIQKHAGDERQVATLARAQERDLRSWLYSDRDGPQVSLASALRSAAAQVEDAHALPVEVVTVGDTPLSERLQPLVLAAGEAMVNAARHSGAARVDVYAECGPEAVEVFVRDRGRGFDPDGVPADRAGVRESIVGRMQRHGGTADVRTVLGRGTEVRLCLGVTTTAAAVR